MDDGDRMLRGQRGQGDLRSIGFLDLQWAVARTVRGQEQDGSPWQTLDEGCQVGFRGLVNPVQILHLKDEGTLPTTIQAHLPEGRKRPDLNRLRAQRRQLGAGTGRNVGLNRGWTTWAIVGLERESGGW